jgi:hypothetical protein
MAFTRRRYFGFLLSVGAIVLAAIAAPYGPKQAYAASEDIAEIFLKAETIPDREKAIELWQTLLANPDIKNGEAGPVFAARNIKAAILEDYLRLYFKERDIDHLEKAKAFISTSYAENSHKAWGYLHIIATLVNDESFSNDTKARRFAILLIDDTQAATQSISNAEDKEKLYYGLGITLSRMNENTPAFGANELMLVHDYALRISDSKSRAQIMRRLALAGKNTPGVYPKSYAPLYDLLNNKDAPDNTALMKLHAQALQNDQFDLALASLSMIKKKKERTEALSKFFQDNFKKQDIARARRIAEAIDQESRAVDVWSELGGHYLIEGYPTQSAEAYKKAEAFAAQIEKPASRKKAQKLIADRKERDQKKAQKKSENSGNSDHDRAKQSLKSFENEGIVAAVDIAKSIKDPIVRTVTFRRLAEEQTKLNDKYGIVSASKTETKDPYILKNAGNILPPPDNQTIENFESEIAKKMNSDRSSVDFFMGLPSSIGKTITHDPLVSRLTANGDTVRGLVPLPTPAQFSRSYYENDIFNGKFYEVFGNAGFTQRQKTSAPEAIIIQSGVADIPALYDYLKDAGQDDAMARDGKTYLLRRPIVIGPKAALIITKTDVDTLRLSTEFGAYIVIVGKLYMSDTKLIGWSETNNAPMWAEYKDKRNFRPFFTAWSQSEIYIGSSEIVALGYGNGKSYGLAMSAGPSNWFKFGNDKYKNRPTGMMVDNSIRNCLYGYYSYEADDVILSGNEYVDNIVYGIDPHDRSHRLAIGYNTAYATQKKHGIIISREVNDSIIFGNLTFENKGTGIMLDRDSNGTLVYGNTSFHNAQDGFTAFESDCAVIAANNIFENKSSGFRLRNSYNLALFHNDIAHNKAAAILAYEDNLKINPAHKHRDFPLDPYDEFTTVTAVGNRIEKNGGGLGVEMIGGLFLKENEFIDQSPRILRGAFFKGKADMLFRYDQEKQGVLAAASCPSLAEPLYVQGCKYRDDGTMRGDGMDLITERVKTSACAQSITSEKKPYIEVDDETEE